MPRQDADPGAHRAGTVALIGRPNAGKSTLMNALLGTRLAITSRRPQTTRQRVTGILSGTDYQALLVDTPGLVRPRDPLQKVMMQTAEAVARDADLVVCLVDSKGSSRKPPATALDWLRAGSNPALLVLSKIDLVAKPRLLPMIEELAAVHDWAAILPLSASKGDGLERLDGLIRKLLPLGPPLFAEGELSEEPERFFAAEFVREQVMRQLGQELPYAAAVEIEAYQGACARTKSRIAAAILVERESQKAIVIGKGGRTIRRIGTEARHAIEALLGRPVHLELRVKVDRNWSRDPRKLESLRHRPQG